MNTIQHCKLGKTDLWVSKIGIGTGTSGFTGVNLQAQMSVSELSKLLIYGYELGINFWDTAYTYGTYTHIKEALKDVNRNNIVICSKTDKAGYKEALSEVRSSLRFLQTDYIDIFLLHGVRNAFDFTIRRGTLSALIKSKEKGYIRAIGFSSHGIGAIESSIHMEYLDVVMARINFSGDYMDSYQEDTLSKMMSIPLAKKMVQTIIPKKLIPSISKLVEPPKPSPSQQEKVIDILKHLHKSGKGIIGMKLFGAGKLRDESKKAISFAKNMSFVDSFVVGITSTEEIEKNVHEYIKSDYRTASLRK